MSDVQDAMWLQYAIGLARLSRDPNTRVGAVIVDATGSIVSVGFNQFARGVAETRERLADRELKNRLMVHAERWAICAAARYGRSTQGTTLYLAATDDTGDVWGGTPCLACSIEVIAAGIRRIVSHPFKSGPSNWRADIEFARTILAEVGVEYTEIKQ